MEEEPGRLSGDALVALVLGIVAWVSFLVALFVARDPFFFLLAALVLGAIAFAFAFRMRRSETAAVAAGAAGAGVALLYGVTLATLLAAMVYATGVLVLIVVLFFLWFAAYPPQYYYPHHSSGCSCGSPCDGCAGSCQGPDCSRACDCGGGCGSCAGSSSCGGGCGTCMALVPPVAPRPPRRAGRFAHHPDAPEFREDVFVLRGERWCVGCFTVYPAFLLATAALLLVAPPWSVALGAGALLALAQAASSAGLARRRWQKVLVKSALGVGLALLLAGARAAPWPGAAKVAALAGALALAALSTLPRARRIARYG